MNVPKKYASKNTNEFRMFRRAMTRIFLISKY